MLVSGEKPMRVENIRSNRQSKELLEVCELCGKTIKYSQEQLDLDYQTYHLDCVREAIILSITRRKVCLDDVSEQTHHFETGQVIQLVSECECEFYTAKPKEYNRK